ncbi:hypothetical protein H9P43_005965 [Blastocladiella emersonii ATCC 22665]|nr:hypothetical protein H9P43_005965 [Blastocladiella emersonii ATCC 22665]
MLDVASEVIDLMALSSTNATDTSSQVYRKWLLLTTLADDVAARLNLIDGAIQGVLNQRVTQSQALCILTFVALVLATCACLAAYVVLAIRKLQREARALTTLLYLISHPMPKELREINRFLESGGLTLHTAPEEES